MVLHVFLVEDEDEVEHLAVGLGDVLLELVREEEGGRRPKK